MARRMSDDEVNNYVYEKLFGDLDGIEADGLFSDESEIAPHEDDVRPNAEPASESSGGVKITVEPIMKAAEESGRETNKDRDSDEEDDDDPMRGISKMSPLMAQLHGQR